MLPPNKTLSLSHLRLSPEQHQFDNDIIRVLLYMRILCSVGGVIAVAENARVGDLFGQEIAQPIDIVGSRKGANTMTAETMDGNDAERSIVQSHK